jgi:hypothetical protein
MKTFVNQSLIDSGDPLALLMMGQGAQSFKMTPVNEWDYKIYEVIYWADEAKRNVKKFGYLLSTPSHIENDVDDFSPRVCAWISWDVSEDVKGRVPFKNTGYGLQSYGQGLYCSIAELKSSYSIKEK